MKFIKLLVVFLLLISCNQQEKFFLKSFKTNSGWGYTITIDNKMVIKQSVIPTLSKQESFKNESDALKVGHIVLDRIKQNLSPTITKKDLLLLEIAI